jgi:hypothetical protein
MMTNGGELKTSMMKTGDELSRPGRKTARREDIWLMGRVRWVVVEGASSSRRMSNEQHGILYGNAA